MYRWKSMVCFQKRKIHSIVMCTLSPWSEIRREGKMPFKRQCGSDPPGSKHGNIKNRIIHDGGRVKVVRFQL